MQKPLENSIIIDMGVTYTRIAICQEGKLSKLFLENNNQIQTQGAIYQGRVSNVVKGMKAAFIDIGTEKKGFLHFNDIPDNLKNSIQNGKRIAVQVVKEGIDNKGPKVTGYYNIKNEFLVLLPVENTIGISKKIRDAAERKRLRSLASEIIEDKYGLIVRTKSSGLLDEEFQQELNELVNKWKEIKPKISSASVGEVLHTEPSLVIKAIREQLKDKTKEIVINNQMEGENIISYIEGRGANSADIVRIADNTANLFNSYGFNKDIDKALGKHIWLKSGANIVIEQTEAMHVIDVNSAKLIKIKNKTKMTLKANKEAARESVRQIKLRGLSGIIVIDFIDMNNNKDKNTIYNIVTSEFENDDNKVKVYPINQLGLLHVTRQKRYNSLKDDIMIPCNQCNNKYGYTNFDYKLVEIEEDIRDLIRDRINRYINLELGPKFYSHFEKQDIISKFERKYNIEILLIKNTKFKQNKYKIYINPKEMKMN